MKAPVCTSPLAIKFLLKDQLVWTICFLLFFWFSITSQVLGQTKQWDKTFGGTKYDGMETIISTPDGGYLLGGTSNSDKGGDKSENSRGGNDYWILKIDGFGQKQWDKTLGGNNDDDLRALVTTPDGGYLLGGSSNSGITGDKTAANFNDCNQYIYCDYDFWIVKVDSRGQKQWDKTYGDSIRYDLGYRLDADEEITSLVATPDGGFLLGGTFNFKIFHMWVVKIDSNGNKQWYSHYLKPYGHHESLSAIVNTSDGGYLLGGSVYTEYQADVDAGKGAQDYWIVKIDNKGKYLWDKSFGGNNYDGLQALVTTSDGGYLLGGYSNSDTGGDKSGARRGECDDYGQCPTDYWLVKIGSNGDILWDKTLGGTSDDELLDLIVTKDGNYLIGGYSKSGIGFEKSKGNYGGADYWLLMLDSQGNKLWDKSYGGSEVDYFSSAITTTDAGYLLSGTSNSNISGDKSEASRGVEDFWLVKMTDTEAPSCTASGGILREYWRNIHGIRVVDIPQQSPPTSTSLLPLFEGPANMGQEYASRIRGYICVPQTGNYTFWIAGDNETQLWLSPDDDPAHKTMIAGHPTWTAPRSWFERITQQSALIPLLAGKRYYIEALHKEGTREDHVAVAWKMPDGRMEAPIPGSRLSPFETDTTPTPMPNTSLAKETRTRDFSGAELQVFPNPFSSATTLAFTSPEEGEALLEIVSLQGSLVQTLFRGKVMPNTLVQSELKGSPLANGMYLARLILNGKTSCQRLVVNK